MTDDQVEVEAGQEADPGTTSAASGWLAGMLGGAMSLAIGELIASLSDSVPSLVTAIGSVVIDLTPGDLIAESINTIGSAQKPLLLGGITVAAILLGGWIGAAGRRDRFTVLPAFVLFGFVGAIAAAVQQLSNPLASFVTALFAAVCGGLLTNRLLKASAPAGRSANGPTLTPGAPLTQASNRRGFLAFGGAAVGTAAVYGASRAGLGNNAAEQARERLIEAATTTVPDAATATTAPPATIPTGDFDAIDGITSRITPISPTDEFYLIDTALSKPRVDPDGWALSIDGFVDTPKSWTYEELQAMDTVEREVTLSCVSNPVGGDLVGNAVWKGILLADLFEDAGIQDPTNIGHQVFMRSVDGFTCGFPVPQVYDGRTAMLALEMNGEPLPINHGFPARIVVAGLYGYVSATKWIEKISITEWDGVDGFWIPRGWAKEGPIKTQSRIDVPRNGSRVDAGPVTMGGIAWSPTVGIDQVEVSMDAGATWELAELANTENDETWVQWRYEWNATPGQHLGAVRATDKSGFTQSPVPVAPAPDGAEGWHTIRINVA